MPKENDKSDKPGSQPGEHRQQRGRGLKKQDENKQKPKPLDSNKAVPMLKYRPSNNFVTFKNRLRTVCMEKYGDLGILIKTKAYWQPPAMDKYSFPNADTNFYEKQALVKAIKQRATTLVKMETNQASICSYMISKMSTKSLHEVKRHGKYDQVNSSVDPLELWKLIRNST